MGKKESMTTKLNSDKKPYFIATRRIYVDKKGNEFLTKKLNLLGRMYNNAVRHYKTILAQLRKDAWYNECHEAWNNTKDEDERKAWSTEIFDCSNWYGLTEYNIHTYLGMGKNQSNPKGINIDILQKVGTNLYQAIKKPCSQRKSTFIIESMDKLFQWKQKK